MNTMSNKKTLKYLNKKTKVIYVRTGSAIHGLLFVQIISLKYLY